MPDLTATRTVDLPRDRIWAFVEDFDNWAPMLQGYVAHQQDGDRESTWTLKGDVGPLSRQVRLKVRVTEWQAPQRVAFELEGLGEDVRGRGSFDLHEDAVDLPAPPPRSWWQRLWAWLTGRSSAVPVPPPASSHVVFTFGIEAGGPMAPMLNAMLAPYAQQVATGLLESVGRHLEGAPAQEPT